MKGNLKKEFSEPTSPIATNTTHWKMKHYILLCLLLAAGFAKAQDLKLNDLEYFERQGVNILVFNNTFNSGFNDKKNSGNVAPGLLFRKPDHFENYDDWPFLWGQNEGTIAGNTQYIIFGTALKDIVNHK